jgi:hypothetical protein
MLKFMVYVNSSIKNKLYKGMFIYENLKLDKYRVYFIIF